MRGGRDGWNITMRRMGLTEGGVVVGSLMGCALDMWPRRLSAE